MHYLEKKCSTFDMKNVVGHVVVVARSFIPLLLANTFGRVAAMIHFLTELLSQVTVY